MVGGDITLLCDLGQAVQLYTAACEHFSVQADIDNKCSDAYKDIRKAWIFHVERLLFKAFTTVPDKVMLENKVNGAMRLLTEESKFAVPFKQDEEFHKVVSKQIEAARIYNAAKSK